MKGAGDAAPDGHVLVGHIAGAHGTRGEVLIKSYTDEPLAIASYGDLLTDSGTQLTVSRVRAAPKGVVASFKGVSGRERAQALKGTKLFVQREQFPAPEADEFYVADLVGLAVVDAEENAIGTVRTVHDFGAGDLLELRLDGEAKTVLLPFTLEDVPAVDLVRGRVTVDLSRVDGSAEIEAENNPVVADASSMVADPEVQEH
ncbi:MAG: ribosome maturation factor RimM [Pseudomonadota bacterium]